GLPVRKLRRPGTKDFRWTPAGAQSPPLWPLPPEHLQADLWLAEGESDCVVLRRLGLEAYALTRGAATPLKAEEVQSLKRRGAQRVSIVFDTDSAGRAGALKLAEVFREAGIHAAVVDLAEAGLVDPLRGQKDVRDAVVVCQRADLLREVLAAVRAEEAPPPAESASGETLAWQSVSLLSAQELTSIDFREPQWLVQGILPEGGVTLLVGKPKIGKSWVALQISCALAGGVPALVPRADAADPPQRRVLYFALEDSPRRLKARLRGAHLPEGSSLHFCFDAPRLGEGWEKCLEDRVRESGAQVVVVDPLVRLRQAQNTDLFHADYSIMARLKELADRLSVTLVVVHHARKQGAEDVIDTILGTTGLAAGADTLLILRRGRGESAAVLSVTGRDVEEAEFALSITQGQWTVEGSAEDVRRSGERQQILDALAELGEARPKEIAELANLKHGVVRHLLRRMCAAGEVLNTRHGVYKHRSHRSQRSLCSQFEDQRASIVNIVNKVNKVNEVNKVNKVNEVNEVNGVYGREEPDSPDPFADADVF
ncbi:MAG: AAA family ATPase, partial [Armatimonadota bacterium]